MKDEIYYCDICFEQFDSIESVCNSVSLGFFNDSVSFDHVCNPCIRLLKSALERRIYTYDRSYKENKFNVNR